MNDQDKRMRLLDEGLGSIPAKWQEVTGLTICTKTGLKFGIHGKKGVRLETLKVAGKRLTSAAAVRRFIVATQFDEPLPVEQSIDIAAADQVLAAHGMERKGA